MQVVLAVLLELNRCQPPEQAVMWACRSINLAYSHVLTTWLLQVAALSCTRLRLVELPDTVSAQSMPQQACGQGHMSSIEYLQTDSRTHSGTSHKARRSA